MIIKTPLSILVYLLLMGSCAGQERNNAELHPFVLKAKETSLYTSQVNWAEVNTRFIELTNGKEGVEEMKEGLQYLINSLGDKHAMIRSATDYSSIVWYTGEYNDEDDRESDFVNKVINAPSEFSYKLLEGKIGYLKVVGIGPGEVKVQSDFIRKGLMDLKEEGVERWIVDLRYNGGGNFEPMVSGLAPLIGDGMVGGAVDSENEISIEYFIENGEFNNYGRIVCPMSDQPKIDATEKVVVLTSRYTVSSGELVAVIFKGRANTKFIGEKTGGYTTGNGWDQISDDFMLVISQSVFMDRNGVVYYKNVDVDESIPFQHNLDLIDDHQVESAKAWLNK